MDKYYLYSFKNIYDFQKFLEKETSPLFKQKAYLASSTGSEQFTGTESYNQATDFLNNGWSAPVAKMASLMINKIMAPKQQLKKSVVGSIPIVPAAIKGHPLSMLQAKKIPQKTSSINIVYNMTGNCNIDADTLINSGLCILNLAQALENNHISTQLNVMPKFSICKNEIVACFVNIKNYSQPFNLKKIAYPLAHASFFRRHGFKFLEVCKDLKNTSWTRGYGVSFPGPSTELHPHEKTALEKLHLDKNSVYIKIQDCIKANFDWKQLAKNKGLSI